MSAKIVLLPSEKRTALFDQLGSATDCPACHHPPVLLVRGQEITVCAWHATDCRFLREGVPGLTVIPGGA